jgi:hypothetical protein
MPQGAFEAFLIRNTQLNNAMQYLESALQQMQFKPMERVWYGYILRGRSMWGDTGKAFLVSGFIPFGSLMKEGNRYGAEFEIQAWGQNVVMRMLFAPYMAFSDQRDVFLLTQGVFEHMTDETHCREFMGHLIQWMTHMGIRMEPYRGQY